MKTVMYKGVKRLQNRFKGIIYILFKSRGIALIENKTLRKEEKGITRESYN